jgi:hypothetical protein
MKTLRPLKKHQQERNAQSRVWHPGERPAHMAYCLCYPVMVNAEERTLCSSPWDQGRIYDSEAV